MVLASASPRRAALLTQIGIPFDVVVPDIDESPGADEAPLVYVERMAREKAAAVPLPGSVVLAADTAVVLDGVILGKPASKAAAIDTLMNLGGRTHQVLTAVAVTRDRTVESLVTTTRVSFIPVDRRLAESYWATGEGADKAGGYGIQGIGGILVERIDT